MKKIITGYRFQIFDGKQWKQSPYPGYSTEQERDAACTQYRKVLEKRGMERVQVVYFVETKLVKEGQD